MSKPIIILGAGASYDYSQRSKPAPLTKELVTRTNNAALNRYPGASELLSVIAENVASGRRTFESELQAFKNNYWDNPVCRKQLVALEFYLQEYFTVISKIKEPINNYKALINMIRLSQSQACVITFNYDSLFEESFEKNPYGAMTDYIKNDIKLIKLHGSHDWVFIQHPQYLRNFKDSFDYYQNNPDFLEALRKEQGFPYHIKEHEAAESPNDHYEKFPAIAIPLQEKQEFLCPKGHREAMEEAIKQADRVLIIGWSGQDKFFADFLAQHIPKGIPITVVSKDEEEGDIDKAIRVAESSEEPAKSTQMVKDNMNGQEFRFGGHRFSLHGNGFSGFIGSDECKNFFK